MTPEGLDRRLRDGLAPPSGEWRPRADLRDAAVLAPIVAVDGADHLLVTRRRADLPDHPGQVAFPGGAREEGEDALTCALRESEEEIGLPPDRVTPLGRLPDRVSIAGFLVAAFAGRVDGPFDLRPDPREVARVFTVPVDALLEEERWRLETRDTPMGRFREVPFFDWDGETVWGLTGIFVRDLVAVLRA